MKTKFPPPPLHRERKQYLYKLILIIQGPSLNYCGKVGKHGKIGFVHNMAFE